MHGYARMRLIDAAWKSDCSDADARERTRESRNQEQETRLRTVDEGTVASKVQELPVTRWQRRLFLDPKTSGWNLGLIFV